MSGGPEGETDAALLRAVCAPFAAKRETADGALPLGVAVSGGGDSMALLHLLHRAAPKAGLRLHCVTVDHGLRTESKAEAEGVANFCAGLGVTHETLHWDGPTVSGNLMDQARRARLTLIADWARGRGIAHVAIGHTADDLAESFLMNLSRAAGLEGLSGMRQAWDEQGVHWVRPLLGQSRQPLRNYLRRNGLSWIDDPSNENPKYQRVRARQAMRDLRPLGVTAETIGQSIAHLSAANEALSQITAGVAAEFRETAGGLYITKEILWHQPAEIRRRLLNGMIRWIGGSDYPPRAHQLARLEGLLQQGRDATLGGTRFRHKNGQVLALREARAAQGAAPVGEVWDNRWLVTGKTGAATGAEVRALGAAGLAQIPDWRETGLLRDAALVLPGIWQQDRLISAPYFGFGKGYSATIRFSFHRFLLSH